MSAADISLYSISIAAIVVLFMVLESTDWGISAVMPYLTKHAGDRRAMARILRPACKGTELCLLAAILWLHELFPRYTATHQQALWGAVAVVVISLLLRTVLAWRRHDDTGAARLLARANALAAIVVIGTAGWFLLTFFEEISFGVLPHPWMWLPMACLSACWAVLALGVQGAYVIACRAANPLAERARATALVLTVPMVLLYLLLFASVGMIGDIPGETLISMLLGVIPLTLYIGGFIAARQRHTGAAVGLTFTALPVLAAAFLFTLRNVTTEFAVGSALAQYHIPTSVVALVAVGTVMGIAAKIWRWRQPREQVATGYEWDTLRARRGIEK